MTLPIGQMRHRFTIQRMSVEQSDSGQLVQSWSDLATRWGSIETLINQSGETLRGGQVYAERTHRVRLRFYPLTSADRLVKDDTIYNITAVNDVNQLHAELELIVKEVAS